ncbi:MAG: gliding motility-associated C-terminal domain-containing protein, partial [Bacteroidetes bacterium]|nr:gliding motility-associated C-terminal domain-containing protein [Bacteroidota bacterium]
AFNVNAVKVTWTAYSAWNGNLKYHIYRKTDQSFSKVLETNLNTWIDYNVCDSEYTYLVIAFNAKDSFYSTSNIATARPVFVQDKTPTNIKSVSVTLNEKILVRWDTTVNTKRTSGYILIVSKQPFTYWEELARTTDGEYEYMPNAIDEIYRFAIIREDICGFTSDTGLYGNNIYLEAETIEDTTLMHWNPYKRTKLGIKNYTIEYANSPNSEFQKIAINKPNDTDYVDSFLRNYIDQFFCYRIASNSKDYPKDTSFSNVSCVSFNAQIYIPNAFTPNKDDLNECFKPTISFVYGGDVSSKSLRYTFTIYDRWGEKIFETNDPLDCWDGTYKNKPAPGDVYIYRINAVGFKNK